MVSKRAAVGIGLVSAAAAFSPAASVLPRAQGHALASHCTPTLRQAKASSLKMIDDAVLQGGLAAAAGLGVAVGGIFFIERKAAGGGDKLTEQQYNKIAGSMEGSDAENKFSGSDQTLDDLIAGMEQAQGVKKEDKPKEEKKKVAVDDDDGW